MATAMVPSSTPASSPRQVATPSRPASHIGHTCAWTVHDHLDRAGYRRLKRFVQLHPEQEATIARKQLEIAVRSASSQTGRTLRLVRRSVVDATEKNVDSLPVIASVDRHYALSPTIFSRGRGDKSAVFQALAAAFQRERATIHTTIVADIIKRYVRDRLLGFSLRDHGGVYFVAEKLEGALFDLETFLRQSRMGHITRLSVGNGPAEINLISREIQRIVEAQIEEVCTTFKETTLSDPASRKRLREKLLRIRERIADMQDLFGFAKQTLAEKDAQARRLMREILRGQRHLPQDLFSGTDDEPTPTGPADMDLADVDPADVDPADVDPADPARGKYAGAGDEKPSYVVNHVGDGQSSRSPTLST